MLQTRTFVGLAGFLTAAVLLAPWGAQANHPDNSCPDTHNNNGESAEQYLVDETSGDEIADGATISVGATVAVHVRIEGHGSCVIENFDQEQGECVVTSVDERNLGTVTATYTVPNLPGTYNSYKAPLDPFGAHVIDTQDPSTTTPGPITTFTSVQAGTYTHKTEGNVDTTFCQLSPVTVSSSTVRFAVGNEVVAKDRGEDNCGVGNPCSVRTGNKFQREEDYSGPLLPFVRYYNSLEPADLGLGYGWTNRYHSRRLTVLDDTMMAARADGRVEIFTQQPGGCWQGDPETKLQVTEQGGVYYLARRDGWVEEYLSSGHLSREHIPGTTSEIVYTYDANGKLEKVRRSDTGHELNFAYGPAGRLGTVTLPDQKTLVFFYQNANLATVTYDDGTTRTYHYEDASFPHHLTGITDEESVRFATWSYHPDGRAKTTEHAQTTNGSPQEHFLLEFDSATQTTVTDPRSNDEIYTFETGTSGRKQLIGKQLADGTSIAQTFDASNRLETRTDELGRTTKFTYDSANRVETRTEADGTSDARTTTFTYLDRSYGPTDLPTSIVSDSVLSGQQRQHQITWHATYAKPTVITQSGFALDSTAVSRTSTMTYDVKGRLETLDGPRAGTIDVTTFDYYDCATGSECGQLKSVTNALSHETTFDSYDDNGRLLQMTDPLGVVTTTTYDDRGRVLTTVQQPPTGSARTWTFTYTPDGQIKTSLTPGGVLLTYTYDAANDLRSIEDSAGNRIEYDYDLAGNRTDEDLKDDAGALQHTIDLVYNTRNRLEQINEGGSVTDVVFDAVGRLESWKDPNLHETTFTYDLLDRLDLVVDPLQGETDFDPYDDDSLALLTAPNGVDTAYESDDLGNRTKEASPDRGTHVYSHDGAGNVTGFTHQESGRVVGFTYDALNRPLTRDYPGTADDVTFTYDTCLNGTGRLCSVTHESGTTSFEYDAFGNVTKRTDVMLTVSYETQYAYDGDDRLTQIVYPTGDVVDYTRDAEGRIQSVQHDPGGGAVPLTSGRAYRGDGLLLSQTWGNGLAETRTYDGRGLLSTYGLGGVESETYTRDPAGNAETRVGSSWSLTYDYDELDRLKTDSGGAGSRTYGYDAGGNRLSLDVDGTPTTSTYEAASNRLDTVGGANITIDAEGRTTATATQVYHYNQAGRLASVDAGSPLSEVGRYTYDAFGLRRTKVAGGVTTVYHYDEGGHLLAETDTAGAALRIHFWADDSPIAQQVGGTLTYLHVDHLDTARWGTDTSGALVWRWRSDGFAVALPEEDVDGDGTDVTVDLRFPGQYFDAETGLHYNRFRYYAPSVGRYISADPIGQDGGVNLYPYAENSPTNLFDPRGLIVVKLGNFGGGGAGVGVQNQGTLAVDTSGNVGIIGTASGGAHAGATGSVGAVVGVSNARTIFDESGGSTIVGASIGGGVTIGVDVVSFQDREGTERGGFEFQLGAGAGSPAEVHVQAGGTIVFPLFNLGDAIDAALEALGGLLGFSSDASPSCP